MRDARAKSKSAQMKVVCLGDAGGHGVTQMVGWLWEKDPSLHQKTFLSGCRAL